MKLDISYKDIYVMLGEDGAGIVIEYTMCIAFKLDD